MSVLVVALARVRLTVAGAAAILNGGAVPVTVSASRVELVRLPEAPLMVITDDPGAADAPAINVSVLVVDALDGLKDAVTPEGKPKAERFTAPLKPA